MLSTCRALFVGLLSLLISQSGFAGEANKQFGVVERWYASLAPSGLEGAVFTALDEAIPVLQFLPRVVLEGRRGLLRPGIAARREKYTLRDCIVLDGTATRPTS